MAGNIGKLLVYTFKVPGVVTTTAVRKIVMLLKIAV